MSQNTERRPRLGLLGLFAAAALGSAFTGACQKQDTAGRRAADEQARQTERFGDQQAAQLRREADQVEHDADQRAHAIREQAHQQLRATGGGPLDPHAPNPGKVPVARPRR